MEEITDQQKIEYFKDYVHNVMSAGQTLALVGMAMELVEQLLESGNIQEAQNGLKAGMNTLSEVLDLISDQTGKLGALLEVRPPNLLLDSLQSESFDPSTRLFLKEKFIPSLLEGLDSEELGLTPESVEQIRKDFEGALEGGNDVLSGLQDVQERESIFQRLSREIEEASRKESNE